MKIDLKVEPIHKHPDLYLQCCDLINSEWPRSVGARMRSLETSSDVLPTCMILLENNCRVLGHAKLTPIPSNPSACYVESVVISKEDRGRGLGSLLMAETEKYCKEQLVLDCIYLSTKGQEMFYSKLGYDDCEPISIYGCGSFIVPNYKKSSSKSYMKKCI